METQRKPRGEKNQIVKDAKIREKDHASGGTRAHLLGAGLLARGNWRVLPPETNLAELVPWKQNRSREVLFEKTEVVGG